MNPAPSLYSSRNFIKVGIAQMRLIKMHDFVKNEFFTNS